MTNILWISPCSPSKKASHAGGQTFYYYFSRFFEDEDFNVNIICSDDDIPSDENEILYRCGRKIIKKNVSKWKKVINLESKFNLWNRHAGMISNYYALSILEYCREYKRQNYYPDVVILEWTAIVLMAKEIKKIFPLAKLVASEADVTYIGYERKKRYYKGIKGLLWRHRYYWEKKLELSSLKYCDLILPHNPDNASVLKSEGISDDKILWLTPFFNDMSNCVRRPNKKDILFYGAMGRMENHLTAIWIIENVLPLLSMEEVRLVVLGSNPKPELKKYEGRKIHITGFVEHVEPFFETASCLVSPLVLGAGIKVKILEGMSSGVPVITNYIGIEGIHATDRSEYILCETAEEVASFVKAAIKGELEEIGKNGQEFVRQNYNLDYSYMRYKTKLLQY